MVRLWLSAMKNSILQLFIKEASKQYPFSTDFCMISKWHLWEKYFQGAAKDIEYSYP